MAVYFNMNTSDNANVRGNDTVWYFTGLASPYPFPEI